MLYFSRMKKDLANVYNTLLTRSHAFALAKPNLTTAILVAASILVCIVLWMIIVPILSPNAIDRYLPPVPTLGGR